MFKYLSLWIVNIVNNCETVFILKERWLWRDRLSVWLMIRTLLLRPIFAAATSNIENTVNPAPLRAGIHTSRKYRLLEQRHV